jgi:hypothetical protein
MLTIVPAGQLPRTLGQVNSCAVCQHALGVSQESHGAAQAEQPDRRLGLARRSARHGRQGLAVVGDSIAIQPGGPHKQISIKVTAKAGTTLSFICAIHPWMQGKIQVS